MGREESFKPRSKRFFRFPDESVPEAVLDREFKIAKTRFPVEYGDEQWAKPGTRPDWVSMRYAIRMVEDLNPNLVEPSMFLGAWEIEREAISMLADVLNHPLYLHEEHDPSKNPPFGWFTPSGTSSMLQATWSLRNKYFNQLESAMNRDFDITKERGTVREEGLLGLVRKGLLDIEKPPVVLAPVDMHFAGDKSMDVLGFGAESIVRYDLTANYTTDYMALENTVKKLQDQGRDVMFAIVTAGAVDTGRVEDVGEFDRTLKKVGCDVPIIVDAAQQYMMLAMLPEQYHKWDFRVPGVEAIVIDPHKTDATPYPGSVVLFRDKLIAHHTKNDNGYLHLDDELDYDMKRTWQLMPQFPTSRSPIGAISTWAHLARNGRKKLVAKYQEMFDLTKMLFDNIKQSNYFEVICEPQTGIIPFHVRGMDDRKARELYHLFESCNEEPRFYISFADCVRLRTTEDFQTYAEMKKSKPGEKVEGFGGLYIQVMHHANEALAEKLFERLESFGAQVYNL